MSIFNIHDEEIKRGLFKFENILHQIPELKEVEFKEWKDDFSKVPLISAIILKNGREGEIVFDKKYFDIFTDLSHSMARERPEELETLINEVKKQINTLFRI